MKNLLISFLALIALQACNDEAPSIPDHAQDLTNKEENTYGLDNDSQDKLESLKVMTYNIHACNPPSQPGIADLDAIANAINEADPDIVLLQEVDKNTGRNGFTGNQSKELGKLTQMNYRFFSAILYMKGYYGVAVLSKYPLKDSQKYMLPKQSGTEQRVLGTAIVDLPGLDSVMVACTHLEAKNSSNRIEQVRELVQQLGTTQVPVILGGDLNERPDTDAFFSIFDQTFTRTCSGTDCPATFSTNDPKITIDYLAYRPQAAFEVSNHQIVQENYASDHFPVMATFKFNR